MSPDNINQDNSSGNEYEDHRHEFVQQGQCVHQ
jgi:hypothetical protein